MSVKSQQSQRQPTASPRRRSSNEDANWAPPFSLLRQVAYGQKKILPRPDVDPSGWHTSLPVVVKGQLLADPDVRLYCTRKYSPPT